MFKKINMKTVQKMAPRNFQISNVVKNDDDYAVSFKYHEYSNTISGKNKREIFDELVKFRIRAGKIQEK